MAHFVASWRSLCCASFPSGLPRRPPLIPLRSVLCRPALSAAAMPRAKDGGLAATSHKSKGEHYRESAMRDAVVRPSRWCLTTKSAILPLPCTSPRLRRHQLRDFREAVLIPSLPSLQVQHPPRCTSGGVSCSYKCASPLSLASVTTVCPHVGITVDHSPLCPSVHVCCMRLRRFGRRRNEHRGVQTETGERRVRES